MMRISRVVAGATFCWLTCVMDAHLTRFQQRLHLLSGFQDDQYPSDGGHLGDQTSSSTEELHFLIDSWWKIALWILAVLLIVLCLCFFGRCCFLIWDCFTDSFWGCCPRHEACKNCLLMKCFRVQKVGKRTKAFRRYQHVANESNEDQSMQEEESTFFVPASSPTKVKEDKELCKEDFVLQTLDRENSNNNINKSNFSSFFPTMERNQSEDVNKLSHFLTSTPVRPMGVSNKNLDEHKIIRANSMYNENDGECAGQDESLPQIHEGHYFNVLNIFRVGGARYEYRVARKHSQILAASQPIEMSTLARERSSPMPKGITRKTFVIKSVGGTEPDLTDDIETGSVEHRSIMSSSQWHSDDDVNDDGQPEISWKSTRQKSKKSKMGDDTFLDANRNDFLLSDSFSSMSANAPSLYAVGGETKAKAKKQRSFGLFIEEGQMGRYNPLPEAQSELWPTDQLSILQNSSGDEMRKAKSMEAFTNKYIPCSQHDSIKQDRPQKQKIRPDPAHSQPVTMERRHKTAMNGGNAIIINHMSRRPPPVPFRTANKLSVSLQPPTPPPPLIEEESSQTLPAMIEHRSLDNVFNFEKTILFGRETNL